MDAFLTPQQRVSAESVGAAKIRSATAEIRNLLAEIDDINERTVELPKLQAQLDESKTQTTVRGQFTRKSKRIARCLPNSRQCSQRLGFARNRLAGPPIGWRHGLDPHSILESSRAWSRGRLRRARTNWPSCESGKGRPSVELWTGLEEIRAIASELERKKDASASQRAGLENRARDIRQKIEERQKGASAIDKRISDLTQQISVLSSLVRSERSATRASDS